MKKYIFKPYNPIFPELFEKENQRLRSYLSGDYQIEHIGSTAVPELGGKGIIDIYIGVPKERLYEVSALIQKAGYKYSDDGSTKNEHLYFELDLPDPVEHVRRYHVHLTYPEYQDWVNALAFRDYLRKYPTEAKRYAEIKQKAAQLAMDNKDIYITTKSPLIQELLKKALVEFKK